MAPPNDVVTRAIDAVCAGEHLTADHAAAVLAEIMEGRTGEIQTGAFLIALRAKGETVPELVGLARTMRSLATPVDTERGDLVDTAGTGGGPTTFNVSTTAALVAAAAGCAVAKHGNRSSTTKCGTADLLEALGVNIEFDPDQVGRCIEEVAGGAPEENAATTRAVLAGESGPRRDIVLINAGAAIYVGGGGSLADGVAKAAEAIDSGAAAALLDRLVDVTTRDAV
jgi:anthranilate phosphoribosyltransferase